MLFRQHYFVSKIKKSHLKKIYIYFGVVSFKYKKIDLSSFITIHHLSSFQSLLFFVSNDYFFLFSFFNQFLLFFVCFWASSLWSPFFVIKWNALACDTCASTFLFLPSSTDRFMPYTLSSRRMLRLLPLSSLIFSSSSSSNSTSSSCQKKGRLSDSCCHRRPGFVVTAIFPGR